MIFTLVVTPVNKPNSTASTNCLIGDSEDLYTSEEWQSCYRML
jgi:hypothetical protein